MDERSPSRAMSINFIIAYSVILQFATVSPQLYHADSNKRYDFDELRISNNHQLAFGRSTSLPGTEQALDGGQSHSTGGSRGGGHNREGADQRITNHIGKPLVPLSVHSAPRSTQPPTTYSPHKSSRAGGNPSLLASVNTNAAQQYGNVCSWMSLREFKNISLDTNELILRDQTDRASYILTMRAFIKWTDDDYFPLSNMKALPYIDHIPVIEVPDDGASARDPRNCSFIAASMADKLANVPLSDAAKRGGNTRFHLFKEDPARFFEEHIKVVVDCGYLIFHIQGDGYNLILKSLSFYQNPGAQRQQPQLSDALEIDQNIQQEHLVFTTKGAKNSPLLIMPLTSRYICQRRIVLVGNNSIQLVLDRFELQKLMGKLLERQVTPAQPPPSMEQTNKFIEWLPAFENMNRHKRNVVFYDIPLCPLNTSVTLVERCPEPASRTSPLNSMMLNATMMPIKIHPKSSFFVDKWTHVTNRNPSSASISLVRGIGPIINCIIALQFIRHFIRFAKSIHSM